MAYDKTLWKARQGLNLNRFTKSLETENSVVLTPDPGPLTVPGTAFSPENMNHIEEGVKAAHEGIAAEAQARTAGDQGLQQAISSEAQARAAGDNGLAQAVASEAQARAAGDQNLQAQISALAPEGLENLPELLAQKAPINATLTDAAASSTLPGTSSTAITALLQTVRNNLKQLFNSKANLAGPIFTGTPQVPQKSRDAENRDTYIATEAQVAKKANAFRLTNLTILNAADATSLTSGFYDIENANMLHECGGTGLTGWHHIIHCRHAGGHWCSQLAIPFGSTQIKIRSHNGSVWSPWRSVSYPKGGYYTQYAGANNAFDPSEAPAVLFGGNWSPMWNDQGMYFQTEGGGSLSRSAGIQEDAIRNITGIFAGTRNVSSTKPDVFNPTGAFYNIGETGEGGFSSSTSWPMYRLGFDSSRVVQTDTRNHPRNRLIKVWKKTTE